MMINGLIYCCFCTMVAEWGSCHDVVHKALNIYSLALSRICWSPPDQNQWQVSHPHYLCPNLGLYLFSPGESMSFQNEFF